MRELSLFSGAGGGLLGSKLLGWKAVGYVERDAYCQEVLAARIADGLLDPAPVFGDIRSHPTIDFCASLSYGGGMANHRSPYLDDALRLYESGFSLAEVAHHYGVTRQSMWKALRRRGAKMRPNLRYGSDNHFYRGGVRASDRVHNLTELAIQRGILHRPLSCQECGASGEMEDGRSAIQAHHDDYNRPLEVRWLCQGCHHEWHRHHRAIPMREEPREVSDRVDVVTAGFP